MSQQWGYGCFESCSMKIYDNFYSYLNIPDTSNRDSFSRQRQDVVRILLKR